MYTFRKQRTRRLPYMLAAVIVLLGYSYWALARPLPLLKPRVSVASLTAPATSSKLVWPAGSQAAVTIAGKSILEQHGNQAPVPMASTAKIITVLTILEAKPLELGQQGPTITLGPNDVAIYNNYVSQGGSVTPVVAGEQITEYQMLQSILLPSANNMADSLAIWAFGSLPDYANAATDYLQRHDLTATKVGSDASGLAPSTVSTARDLVKLGELAMKQPLLAQIVGQTTANGIPVANSIKNVNFLLGTSGIVGIKTGNSDQAGGVFVGASSTLVDNQPVVIITAVAGAPSLFAAMQQSLTLIRSAQTNFTTVTVAKAGQVVGSYDQPWGGTAKAVAERDLSMSVWNGSSLRAATQLRDVTSAAMTGYKVGNIHTESVTAAQVPVVLQRTVTSPSAWWRFTHPFN